MIKLATVPEYTPMETREKPLWWHERGLQYTATGYGRKIPTRYQVRDGKRWKRVYICQYGNAGTAYFMRLGERVVVDSL
jgi:hypothetical protein